MQFTDINAVLQREKTRFWMFFNHKKQVKKHLFGVKKPSALVSICFPHLFVALSV